MESFSSLVDLLDIHLSRRPYIFGARPAFGDFGLWGQLFQARTDPTCESILNQRGPGVVTWLQRMQRPSPEGSFESLSSRSHAPTHSRTRGRCSLPGLE
ncbi:MAG: glutathione S-transferase C-terminal domain-containing protein [Myxococcota bacterium]